MVKCRCESELLANTTTFFPLASIHSKIGVFHHFHRQTCSRCFVVNGLSEFNINVHVVVIAEEIWENGVDGKTFKFWQAEEMRANVGLPVR